MSELATTYVRIRPRSTGFKAEADTQLRRETPGDVEVGVTADTSKADDRLRLLGDKLDGLRLKSATATIDINDRVATGKLSALDAALDRLDRLRANPQVDLEGVAKAEAQIRLLNEQLDHLDSRGSGRGGRGALGALAGFGRGGFFGGRGLLSVAAGAGAVPLGIAGLGLGASFLTPTVAGTAGLGLFGAATHSALTRVSTAEDKLDALNKRIALTSPTTTTTTKPATGAQIQAARLRLDAARQRLATAQATPTTSLTSITSARAGVLSAQTSLAGLEGRGGSTTTQSKAYQRLLAERRQLLKQLTPEERKAAESTGQLEKAWLRFQRALEPQSFTLLATGSKILRKGLDDLLPMTKAVGVEVDDLATRADHALSQPFWQHFFHDFLTVEAPRAVDALGTTIGNVVEGIAHLSERFAPLGHDLEDVMVKLSRRFDQWAQGSGPQRFLSLLEKDGPLAAQAVHALGGALLGLGRGLEPIGRVELQAVAPVLRFVTELGQQHPQVITDLGIAYLTVAGGLKAIGAASRVQNVLQGVTGDLKGLRRGALLTAGAVGAFGIGAATPNSGTGVVEAGLGGALTGLTVGLAAGGPFGAALGAAGGALVGLAGHFLTVHKEVDATAAAVQALTTDLTTALSLDKGIAGSNVKAFLGGYLQQHPGATSAFAQFNVTEKELITYLSGKGATGGLLALLNKAQGSYSADGFTPASKNVRDAVQALTDLAAAFGTAQTNANNLLSVTGGDKTGGHHGGKNPAPAAPSSPAPAVPHGAVRIPSQAQGQQAGADYTTGMAAGIVANIPKVEVAVTRLTDRLANKLKAAQQRETQLSQSLASTLLGQVGLTTLGSATDSFGNPLGGAGSASSIISGLRGQRHDLRHFRHELHVERRRGLSAREAQQIAGLGLTEGGALADTLFGATPKQLAQISRLDAHLRGLAQSTGHDIAHDIFGQRVSEMTGVLRRIHREIAHAKTGSLSERDLHKLKVILKEALHDEPVVFDHGKHSRRQAREVWTS